MTYFQVPELNEGNRYVNATKFIVSHFDEIKKWEVVRLYEDVSIRNSTVRVDVYAEDEYPIEDEKEVFETVDGITLFRCTLGIFQVYFRYNGYVVCLCSKLNDY